jgi:membrane-bound serine protease (ClpP class)
LVRVSLAALSALVTMVLAARFLPSSPDSPFGGKLVLRRRLDRASGATSHPQERTLVGAQGEAVTPLRPTGKALFDGVRRDVVSEAEFLDVGTTVEVLRTSGAQLVVRRLRKTSEETHA